MTTATAETKSLAEIKAAVKANLGTPGNNANAAAILAGTTFLAETRNGEFVVGTVLPTLSGKGKVQAELACAVDGCCETHTREQSDWHQSMKCRTHAALAKVKLTAEEKSARKVAKAQALIASLAPAAV